MSSWTSLTSKQRIAIMAVTIMSLLILILGIVAIAKPMSFEVGGKTISNSIQDAFKDRDGSPDFAKTAITSAYIGGIFAIILGLFGFAGAALIWIKGDALAILITVGILVMAGMITAIIAIVANSNLNSMSWWLSHS